MRKISIGIFSVAVAILFILSTSVSVTAATHRETLMVLDSQVDKDAPKASVSMDPQDVWQWAVWNWTLDITNGDNVIIDTTCNYFDANTWTGVVTGEHNFDVYGAYVNGMDVDDDEDHESQDTYGAFGGVPEQGSLTMTVTFNNVDEGGTITLQWFVEAKNIATSDNADMNHYGTVYLT
jgi:hypothetical protein